MRREVRRDGDGRKSFAVVVSKPAEEGGGGKA